MCTREVGLLSRVNTGTLQLSQITDIPRWSACQVQKHSWK